MPYNFATESFYTKKRCETFFERSTLVEEKMVNLHFLSPFGGLGATYAVHLRLIGKLVVGLPISDN